MSREQFDSTHLRAKSEPTSALQHNHLFDLFRHLSLVIYADCNQFTDHVQRDKQPDQNVDLFFHQF